MIIININYKNYILKFTIVCYQIFIIFVFIFFINSQKEKINKNTFNKLLNSKDYKNNKFIIVRHNCNTCGLFSFYKLSIGCISKVPHFIKWLSFLIKVLKYLTKGYIPIIDLKSYPNIINGFDTKKNNIWEIFFVQPFGYNLEEVMKKAKKIKMINEPWKVCTPWPDQRNLPFEESKRYFWYNFAKKFSPIKRELIDLSNKIMNNLFKNSKNILGVLARGTDYIAMKPKAHPVQPNLYDIIKDIKSMDDKYNYDYIFFSSEDQTYKDILSKSFPDKIKQIKSKININYDYKQKQYLGFNKNVKGNIEFNKIYLLNIIILSKCLDLIATKCNGTVGLLILSNGFRNTKIYDLGLYHWFYLWYNGYSWLI